MKELKDVLGGEEQIFSGCSVSLCLLRPSARSLCAGRSTKASQAFTVVLCFLSDCKFIGVLV